MRRGACRGTAAAGGEGSDRRKAGGYRTDQKREQKRGEAK